MDNAQLIKLADHLFRRGLQLYGQSSEPVDLARVSKLFQQAWANYCKAGEEAKAREVQKSLVKVYRDQYRKAHGDPIKGKVKQRFTEWWMFFKIGCFGFGGPMAVFTLLEDALVRDRKILTNQDFLEGAVLGDVLPGPVTMDIVTYTGYKLKKWSGALIATLAFIAPSFVIMLVLAMLYDTYSITPKISVVMKCLGAAVTGLILSVGLKLTKAEMKGYRELCILVWAFASSIVFKLDIVLIVGLSGLVGMVIYHDETDKKALGEPGEDTPGL